ncbi:MAG: 4Fe-4S dicluster domain-containing protein [Bacteroidales bacterium]|nr:4Fe-4S dicluster domain-containing protein [Bacteroidales bacterium]
MIENPALLNVNEEKCTICFACTRACPVKAFKVVSEEKAPELIHKRCIDCGKCIESCSPGAITFRDTTEEALKLMKSDNDVVVILSSAFAGEFEEVTDYRKLVQMIRSLGVKYVIEESFAVDIVAHKYLELFKDFKGRYYITANDPVVVNYVEKYKPQLINNLAPIVSPMVASATVVSQLFGDHVKKIYIGPEIARKNEALKYKNSIDVVLTFIELRRLFERSEISESRLEYSDFDLPKGFKGVLYPIVNGFVQAAEMDENLLTTKVLSIEGPLRMMEAIEEFEKGIDTIQKHLNVSFGNALQGPGTTNKSKYLAKKSLVLRHANKQLKNFFRFEWNKGIKEFADLEFKAIFKRDDQRLPDPGKKEIESILQKLNAHVDTSVGCHDCGYQNCYEFAKDIAQNLTIPEMCDYFSRKEKSNLKKTTCPSQLQAQ